MTRVNGWRFPTFISRPGKVTSIDSLANFSAIAASSSTAAFDSNTAVTFSRTLFTKAPIFGRSSADNLPIPFNKSVIGPFFPKYATRTSFNSFRLAAASILASASCSNCFNCSSMLKPP